MSRKEKKNQKEEKSSEVKNEANNGAETKEAKAAEENQSVKAENTEAGIPVAAPWKQFQLVFMRIEVLTGIHKDACSSPGLPQWLEDLVLPRAVV